MEFNPIFFALIGGILPAIIWLLFWLKEDVHHPESPFLITKTFILGMCLVILVLPFQKIVNDLFPDMSQTAFVLWALIEEGFKFAAAYFLAIRTREDDEPVDTMIYMITVALGFVALENALFIFDPLIQQDLTGAISSGLFRFIGASLLHVLSSATIGTALALTFYKKTSVRVLWGTCGFILAVAIHTAFNLFLINGTNTSAFSIFGSVWIGVVLLLVMFEKVKALRRIAN